MKKIKVKKKILIGGGAGYIGSVLAPFLVRAGYDVTVVDLLWFGNHLPKSVKIVQKNLFDIKRDELKNYDQFIFLAGLSNDPMAHWNPKLNYLYNAALPAFLAYESKMAGIKRFIYGSSCSIYGNTTHLNIETTIPNTSEPYGISKFQGEIGVLKNQCDSFSTFVLRQGTVCGYSPRMRFDLVINTMIKTALTHKHIIVENPNIWRPICGMNDLLRAYLLVIESRPSLNGIFNIASGNYQVLSMAKKIKIIMDEMFHGNINIIINDKKIERNYRVSLIKSRLYLKFTPQENLNSIVKETILKSKKIKKFNDDNYYNIDVFKRINLSIEKYSLSNN